MTLLNHLLITIAPPPHQYVPMTIALMKTPTRLNKSLIKYDN